MLLTTRLPSIILGVALAVSTTCALPITSNFKPVLARAPRVPTVKDPCVSTIDRTSANQAKVAAACFAELSKHILEGGKSGVLNSNSGNHLASVFLPTFRGTSLRNVDANSLLIEPDTDGTKTLWMDEGLSGLFTKAQAAQRKLADAEALLTAAKNKVKAQEEANSRQKNGVQPQLQKLLRAAQGKRVEAEAAFAAATIPDKDKLILNLAASTNFPTRTRELYNVAGIEAMCIDAMQQSLALEENKGHLKGGKFSVLAKNLLGGSSFIDVQLLQGSSNRINSCFPVL